MNYTELQGFISAIRKTGDRPGHTVERMSAKLRLADYVLDHDAAFTERDRLERAVVEAVAVADADTDCETCDEYWMSSVKQNALSELADWLVSNAASNDPAVLDGAQ